MKQKNAVTTRTQPADIAVLDDVMTPAGQAANQNASRHTFTDQTARKAENTIRRKRADPKIGRYRDRSRSDFEDRG